VILRNNLEPLISMFLNAIVSLQEFSFSVFID